MRAKRLASFAIIFFGSLESRAMELLRTLRERKRWSQAALAERCHCHPTTISQMEAHRMVPSLELFARLSRALKVSPTRLLREFVPEEDEEETARYPVELQDRERRERRAEL